MSFSKGFYKLYRLAGLILSGNIFIPSKVEDFLLEDLEPVTNYVEVPVDRVVYQERHIAIPMTLIANKGEVVVDGKFTIFNLLNLLMTLEEGSNTLVFHTPQTDTHIAFSFDIGKEQAENNNKEAAVFMNTNITKNVYGVTSYTKTTWKERIIDAYGKFVG